MLKSIHRNALCIKQVFEQSVGYNSVDVSTVHKKNESLYFEILIDYIINCIQKEKVTSAAKFHGIILGA